MERSLLTGAFVLSWIVVVCSILLTYRHRRGGFQGESPLARRFLFAGIGFNLLAFLATLPGRAPFLPGHRLGSGLLLGTVGALGAALLSHATTCRVSDGDSLGSRPASL